jgi:hypothetical protein
MLGALFGLLKNKTGLLIIGILLLGFGGLSLLMEDGTVRCGGETMTVDDVCEETRRGRTTVKSYDEVKSEDHMVAVIAAGAGGLMTLIGGVWMLTTRTKKVEPEPTAANVIIERP